MPSIGTAREWGQMSNCTTTKRLAFEHDAAPLGRLAPNDVNFVGAAIIGDHAGPLEPIHQALEAVVAIRSTASFAVQDHCYVKRTKTLRTFLRELLVIGNVGRSFPRFVFARIDQPSPRNSPKPVCRRRKRQIEFNPHANKPPQTLSPARLLPTDRPDAARTRYRRWCGSCNRCRRAHPLYDRRAP